MKFAELPKYSPRHYRVTQDWDHLEVAMHRYMHEILAPLDIDPPFQRGHVWTAEQQIKYVEYKLQGGSGSDELYFNCPGWMQDFKGPFQLVDGKQRIEAVLKFLKDNMVVFGKYKFSDFTDRIPSHCFFHFNVNNLRTEKSVLLWYYKINFGGTPHPESERLRIIKLIEDCDKPKPSRRLNL